MLIVMARFQADFSQFIPIDSKTYRPSFAREIPILKIEANSNLQALNAVFEFVFFEISLLPHCGVLEIFCLENKVFFR